MLRRLGLLGMIVMVLAAGSPPTLGASVREIKVPRTGDGLLVAYARLHAAGFRVSIAGPWTFTSSTRVRRTAPAAGRLAPAGSVVTLSLDKPRPSSRPARHHPVRIPSFTAQPVSVAYSWANAHRLGFTAHLGALHAGNAAQLLANFVVSGQRSVSHTTNLTVWGHERTSRPPSTTPSPAPPPTSTAPPSTTATTTTAANTSPLPPPPPNPITYYQNPVYSAAAFPDPFVLDNGGAHDDYWAFATGNLFPVLHSRDLVHWTSEPTAMNSPPSWVVQGNWNPWAPSLIQLSPPCPATGCYVMYYVGESASVSANAGWGVNCIGVATATNPGGPYTDRGPLALGGASGEGMPIGCGDASGAGNIDPSPFIDPSTGTAYLYVSTDRAFVNGQYVRQPTLSVIPLEPGLMQASGPRVALLTGAAGTWEDAGGSVGPTVEGPSMELHDGTYYLLYSGGSYTHAYGMGYATSTSPTGPFTKAASNPFFASTSDAFGVGGGDRLVTGPHGGQWMVYAARTSAGANRTLWIDPFSWEPAGISGAPDVPVVSGPTTTPQSIQP